VILLPILALWRSPSQADQGSPPIQRVFKRHQIDRYSVILDWDGDQGKAHYDYEMKMAVEHVEDKVPDVKVEATFLNLKSSFDGREAPVQKTFGAAPLRFISSGFPLDLVLGGQTSMFMMPFLAWYLPKEPLRPGTNFTVPDTEFDSSIRVGGAGAFQKERGGGMSVSLNLTVRFGDKAGSGVSNPSTMTCNTFFDLKTGTLIASDGNISIPSGTIVFRIKRR